MSTNATVSKRGRPAYKPTAAARRGVSIAAGGGMRHEDIAIALGISRDTLAKYFEAELSVGANLRRMEVMQALHAAAKRGSSSAAKAYLALDPQLAAPPIVAPAAERAEKLGKKAEANEAARVAQVGTDWDHLLTTQAAPLQ